MMLTSQPNDPRWRRVLVVDDEPAMLSTLREVLTLRGFLITTADEPEKALDLMQQETFAAIMSDQDMPNMTGLALLAKARDLYPATTRLLITGKVRAREIAEATDAGILYRYIPKPYMLEDLVVTLRAATERFQLLTENAQLRAQTAASLAPKQEAQGSRTAQFSDSSPDESGPVIASPEITPEQAELAVNGLVKVLYSFYPNLGNTAVRSVALCRTIAEILQLPPDDVTSLLHAAALHDIALVGIDRGIVRRYLRSSDKCTEDELKILKRHPEQSADLLGYSPVFEQSAELIRCHHENVDGGGYPSGLKEEMIPWLSRVLAVVIHYCSSHSAGVERMKDIESKAGAAFDAKAVEITAKAIPLTRMPLGEREILLHELKPKMVLARDIHNAHGMLLFPKGREMTEASINKVWSIDRMAPLDQLVLVYA